MSNDSSALYQNTSNANQDLHTLPYYCISMIFLSQQNNFTMWILRMMHYAKHMQLSSKGWSKCMYFADLPRAIYIPSIPGGINYCLHTRGDRWPCSTQVAYFRKVTQINLLVFLTLIIYLKINEEQIYYQLQPLSSKGSN